VLASGFYRVQPDEQGVVLRFGQWVKTTNPGLNWRLPSPIESVLTPKVTRINSLDIGFRSAPTSVRPRPLGRRRRPDADRDENIVDIQYTVFWKINDAPVLFNIASPEAT